MVIFEKDRGYRIKDLQTLNFHRVIRTRPEAVEAAVTHGWHSSFTVVAAGVAAGHTTLGAANANSGGFAALNVELHAFARGHVHMSLVFGFAHAQHLVRYCPACG